MGNRARQTTRFAPHNRAAVKLALLAQVDQALENRGYIRFRWATGEAKLITVDGRETAIDGRSYHAFIHSKRKDLVEKRTGTTTQKNLVIEWRLKTDA